MSGNLPASLKAPLGPAGDNRFRDIVTGVAGLFVISPSVSWPSTLRRPLADIAAMDAVEGRVTRLPEKAQ